MPQRLRGSAQGGLPLAPDTTWCANSAAPLRLAPQAQKPPAVGATSRQPESQPARPRQPKSHNAAPSARGPSRQPKPQPEAEPAEAQTQPQPKPQPGERGPQPAQETAKPGIADIAPGKQKAEQEPQPEPEPEQRSIEGAEMAGPTADDELRADDALLARHANAGVGGAALAQPQPCIQALSPKPLSDTGDQEGEIQVALALALAELGQAACQLRRHTPRGLPIAEQEPVELRVVVVIIVVSFIIAEPAEAPTADQEAHDQPLTLVVEIQVEIAIAQSRHPQAAEKAAQ